MDTIIELRSAEGSTAILISHDLGIVLEATVRVVVVHEGQIVEDGRSLEVLRDPQDDSTKTLLSHQPDPRAAAVSLLGFPDRWLRDSSPTRQETPSSISAVGSRERSAAKHPPWSRVAGRLRCCSTRRTTTVALLDAVPNLRRGGVRSGAAPTEPARAVG